MDRFWNKVDIRGSDDCWLWTASTRKGYGQFHTTEGKKAAHRVAWELIMGPIPAGRIIMHECDVRRCVNPAHLRLSYQRTNIRDSVRKGRWGHSSSREAGRRTGPVVMHKRWHTDRGVSSRECKLCKEEEK